MRLSSNKKFLLTMVLLVSILQIIVPFLHAHYEQRTSMLHGIHIHEINIGKAQNQEAIANVMKSTSVQSYHSEVKDIDNELTNHNQLNIIDFSAIFLFIIFALCVASFHFTRPTSVALLPNLFYRLSFSRAPPSF